jgi:hypothetical protein
MNDAGHQGVVGASGTVTARLEELQLELGEGRVWTPPVTTR